MMDKNVYIERKKIYNLVDYLKQSTELLQGFLSKGDVESAISAMEACQNCAIVIGTQVEEQLGEGTESVKGLEIYCEDIYLISEKVNDEATMAEIFAHMAQLLEEVKLNLKKELELNKIVILYQVNFKKHLNEDDLIEKKVLQIFEMLKSNPQILMWWYVDLSELLKWGLVREEYMECIKRLFEQWGNHPSCILDMSRDEKSALEIADAFYGDRGGLYKKFNKTKKPIMVQDMNCVPGQMGYVKSAYLKKIQEVELDMLYEFQRVCKKHDIRYFAYAGTMLGAVRNGGMIPWDDDLDIMMLRKDYEKLLAVAQDEFNGKYFFQCPQSEPRFLFPGAGIRNSETTAILLSTSKRDVNMGMFVDIFILDSIPDDDVKFREECDMLSFYYQAYTRRMYYLLKSALLEEEVNEEVKALAAREDFLNVVAECDKKREAFDEDNSKYLTIYSELVMAGHPFIFEREWFEDTVELPFENTTIPVPVGYDAFLKKMYGDYMTEIRGESSHGSTFFDVDKSYREYIN